MGGLDDDEDDEDDYENDNNDISIETSQDGVLKLCCSDPQVLQVTGRREVRQKKTENV